MKSLDFKFFKKLISSDARLILEKLRARISLEIDCSYDQNRVLVKNVPKLLQRYP